MKKIIPIDENTRIVIEPGNYILEYRRKSKDKITWRISGYHADLVSLAIDYLNESPQRTDNAIGSIKKLIETIRQAESKICKIINNKKQ